MYLLKTSIPGASEVAGGVKARATKTDDLDSNPEIHVVEKELTPTYSLSSDLHLCAVGSCVCIYALTK